MAKCNQLTPLPFKGLKCSTYNTAPIERHEIWTPCIAVTVLLCSGICWCCGASLV